MAFQSKGAGNVGDRMRKLGGTEKKKKKRVKKSYQRFFDGYVEIPVDKGNGKVQIERLYVADYHEADLPTGRKVLVRAAHLALFALTLFLFSRGALMDAHFNLVWYCVIFEALSVGAIVFGIITLLFRYIPYFGKMTRWQYKQAVVRLGWIQKLSPLFIAASALTALFSVLFHPEDLKTALAAILWFVLAALTMLTSLYVEKRVPYKLVPSGNKAPIGAIDISTMKEIKPPKKNKEESYGGEALEELEFEADDEEVNDELRYF